MFENAGALVRASFEDENEIVVWEGEAIEMQRRGRARAQANHPDVGFLEDEAEMEGAQDDSDGEGHGQDGASSEDEILKGWASSCRCCGG